MSTDDSISEDVSSSVGFSHCPADGGEGKESETSLVSSEGTAAPQLLVSEDRLAASHTSGGTVQSKLMAPPALQNIRDICLTPEIFGHGKNLPFMNPSSIESLRALMQEIRCSGVTNPDLWKDCEGRWLHLFQLVEKQYQEQILAQQEQYQCQIQLIQDEIKALVQIQNLHSFQPLSTFSTNNIDNLEAEDVTAEEPASTVLSSGYGTLFPWKTDTVRSERALGDEPSDRQEKLPPNTRDKTSCVVECQQKHQKAKNPVVERVSTINQQQTSVSNQLLTSWAQMNKLRPKRNKTRPLSVSANNMEVQDKHVESHQLLPVRSKDSQQNQSDGPSYGLRRSDSLISEASGLTYWQLHENDLYHLLPDSFDSGVHLLRDTSMGFIPCQPSLKEIYCNKQTDFKCVDVDSSLSPHQQVLDPAVNTRHSDCTSGFTSPSHFSSPSFSTPSHPGPRADTPLMPDSNNHGEMDCISDTSSVCAARRYFLHPAPVQKSKAAHRKEDSSSFEDPVTLSLLRQNLREKHSRHVADLKAYYESEIQNLLEKLRLNDLPKDVEKSNQALSERCRHLEKALADATSRIQELEANNCSLEKKMTEWSDRYAVAAATVRSLQKMLEDNKRSAKEGELMAARLKKQMQQLEEAAERAEKESNENKTKREMEYKRLQELLVEHESVVKKHEGLESNLVSTKSSLVDAHQQISELKGIITKLESQVKQLEHENHNRVHYSNSPASGAGLFHHPDLLLSPSKKPAQPDVIRTLSHSPISQMFDSTKSFVKIPSKYNSKHPHKSDRASSGQESPVDITSGGSWNSDRAPPQYQSRLQDVSRKASVSNVMTPVMRALIELEETRATQSRAPWVDSSKSTVGVVEQRLKVPLQEQGVLQDLAPPQRQIDKDKVSALHRSVPKESHRSSSLPPPAQHNMLPPNTPAKRETLRMPLSAKSSPKRCPTENFSTAFGHLMPREEHLQHSSRKWIPFTSAEADHADVQSSKGNSQLDWDEWRQSSVDKASGLSRVDRELTLAEAERLFDELTQEKMQVEAALSRIPGAGRQTMQTRLNEVSLEKKLERLSQELGFLRMALKKFHALHSSAKS